MTKNDPPRSALKHNLPYYSFRTGTAMEQGMPASRHSWTRPTQPFRVHFYDALRSGTWHRYFDDYQSARDFAQGRRVYAEPCAVERRPG